MGREQSRWRYRLAILVITLAVAGAGCSTVLPGSDGTAAYTASGDELNGTTLAADHADRLRSAGSFTTQTTLDVSSTNQSARIDTTTLVDLDADRALRRSTITTNLVRNGELHTETFTADGETYRRLRIQSGEQSSTQYRHITDGGGEGVLSTGPVNGSAAINPSLARRAADAIEWTQTGTVVRNGTTLTRYEARGPANFTDFRNVTDLGPAGTNLSDLGATLDDVSAVLLVDSTGLVAEFRFAFTGTGGGEAVSLSFTVRTTDVDATTVPEPDWLETARERT